MSKNKKMELSIFYTQALNLQAPWQITKTEMDVKGLMILVHLGHEKGALLPRPNVDKIKSDGVVKSHLVSLRCSDKV